MGMRSLYVLEPRRPICKFLDLTFDRRLRNEINVNLRAMKPRLRRARVERGTDESRKKTIGSMEKTISPNRFHFDCVESGFAGAKTGTSRMLNWTN